MQSLLLGEQTQLRCGAGWAEYNVQTDGNLSPCPVMSGMKDFYAGNISAGRRSVKKVLIGGRCTGCDIKGLCGGRCLYANVTMKWGPDGFDEALRRVPVPFNERTASRAAVSLPRGARVAIPDGKQVRLFLHWCEPENGDETDLDLSVALYDAGWDEWGRDPKLPIARG
jgi:radical SAM protein with 4Fe4S-binding SPASM domain